MLRYSSGMWFLCELVSHILLSVYTFTDTNIILSYPICYIILVSVTPAFVFEPQRSFILDIAGRRHFLPFRAFY